MSKTIRLMAVAAALALAGCHMGPDYTPHITPLEWMLAAKQTIHDSCTTEADNSGATGDVWENVYDMCAQRTAIDLELHSTDRPPNTGCEIKPTWCHG